MDDLISRQQAIDAVCEEVMDRFFVPPSAGYDVAEEALKKLPSVQPEMNCSEIPNNSDTISRQAAIDAIRDYLVEKRCPDDGTLTCRLIENEVINKLPSVQPERKTGHWIAITSWNNTYKCSVCGRLLVNITDGKNKVAKNYPYCHCGADMRGEQE